jgi:hypothetical protein
MSIKPQWKYKFGVLKNYISFNSDISIGRNETHIPEHLRDNFYRHFDEVRRAFVESWESSFSFDVHSLAEKYIASENRLSEISNIRIDLPLDLSSFLHNPKEGMMRLIYNRLFELVQGKTSEDDFERMAQEDLVAGTMEMFRMGYAAWAALALILQLEPEEFFGIALDKDQKPIVTGFKEIAFGRQFHHPAKRIPEFIFHSKKLCSYLAFKMPLAREADAYYVPFEMPTQRLLRNRNGDSSSALDCRIMFLSVVPDLKKIPVYADLHERTINGPDLTIECLMEQELSDTEAIHRIQNRADIIKPRLGCNAIVMDPKPESGSFKIGETIDAFSVGLDPSKLRPIIDNLV